DTEQTILGRIEVYRIQGGLQACEAAMHIADDEVLSDFIDRESLNGRRDPFHTAPMNAAGSVSAMLRSIRYSRNRSGGTSDIDATSNSSRSISLMYSGRRSGSMFAAPNDAETRGLWNQP